MQRVHDRFEEEPVHSAVPDNMHKRDQVVPLEGSGPCDALSAKSVSPTRNAPVFISGSKGMEA